MQQPNLARPFSLDAGMSRALPRPLGPLVLPLVERLLSLSRLDAAYRRLPRSLPPGEFARRALALLGVRFEVEHETQFRIPRSGPVVVVANHPIGGLEGIFLIWLLSCLRADFRVLGNSLLRRLPELAECIIPVDVFGGSDATQHNGAAMRQALRYLRSGGALVAFPAGEVSSLQPGTAAVSDPPWSPAVVRMARLTGAAIVPVHLPRPTARLFTSPGWSTRA